MKIRYSKTSRVVRGFTLLEVLVAVILVGMVVAALIASSGTFTLYNAAGLDISNAEFLTEEVRELTAQAAFDSLSTYVGSHNPPIDAGGEELTDFSAYTQVVSLNYVSPTDLTEISASSTDFYRVTVTITKSSTTISSTSWVRAKY